MAKFCTNCGQSITEEQEKCEYCGKVLKTPTQIPVNQTSTQNTNENANQNQNTVVNNQQSGAQPKSKIVAILLAFFLGSLGIHNFYLGYTGKGIAQLLITILSCGMLVFVSGIWSFIEFIMLISGAINKDGNGVPLTD